MIRGDIFKPILGSGILLRVSVFMYGKSISVSIYNVRKYDKVIIVTDSKAKTRAMQSLCAVLKNHGCKKIISALYFSSSLFPKINTGYMHSSVPRTSIFSLTSIFKHVQCSLYALYLKITAVKKLY